MQDQQDIQSVKTWQAPELIELGGISKSTENGGAFGSDGSFQPTS